ncbi:MAG: hypothetical protein LBQ66_14385 [Planctomycetaceae bacterium]|nr:hypothetical protein [Planctomycetaceae bacterium]
MSENQNEIVEEQTEKPDESNETRVKTVEVAEYVVQWKLLIGGLVTVVLLVAVIVGVYLWRSANLTTNVIETVNELMKEATDLRNLADREYGKDTGSKEYLDAIKNAYAKKISAASLLKGVKDKRQDDIAILRKYFEVLESLLKDEEGTGTIQARRRGEIIETCKDIVRNVNIASEAMQYQKKILELEWKQHNNDEVLERSKQIYRQNPEDYDALRYIALSAFQQVAAGGRYNPSEVNFPHNYFDDLLDKVHKIHPEDLEVATCYAGFIIDVQSSNFAANASTKLTETSEADRVQMAQAIIDEMVARNSDKVLAYLTRYNFNTRFEQFIKKVPLEEKLDSDLESVLRIDPENVEGLILAGRYSYRQATAAQTKGNTKLAETLRARALEYLKRAVDKNQNVDVAYQFLGDFYLSNGDAANAIKTWEIGVERTLPYANPELVGRLVIAYISLKEYDRARKTLAHLDSYSAVRNMRFLQRVKDMRDLLAARLDAYEAWGLRAKAMSIQDKQDPKNIEEINRLFTASNKKLSDAAIALEIYFKANADTIYNTTNATQFEATSIFSQIVSEGALLLGRLMVDQGKPDSAKSYYIKAMAIPRVAQAATIAAAGINQQQGNLKEALDQMKAAVNNDQNNVVLRFLYVQSLFRYCMTSNTVTNEDLDNLRDNLLYLETKRADLTAPWIIDIALIQLEITRASLANDLNILNKATQDAIGKFKAIEKREMPPQKDREGKPLPRSIYSQHLPFMSSIAAIYATSLQTAEYERVLSEIRSMPGGEYAYYSEVIREANRRGDYENVVDIITNEIPKNEKLTAAQKESFKAIIQTPDPKKPSVVLKVYDGLKKTFETTPEVMGPSSLFTLAIYELDQGNVERTKELIKRIKVLEGDATGTLWRYLQARVLLLEKNPPYDEIREIQKVISNYRPTWDMGYLLQAAIEESAFAGKKMDDETLNIVMKAYSSAIAQGNLQPLVWNRYIALLEILGLLDQARSARVTARLQNISLDADGLFPQPYQRMYNLVADQINSTDTKEADKTAQRCIILAESKGESKEFIYSLHKKLGKLFLDNNIYDSAIRHLKKIADVGGINVYPLAVTYAKANRADEGFNLILDEIDKVPSMTPQLLSSTLVLLEQAQPSEKVYQRIDKLINRVENGERLTLSGNEVPEDRLISLGRKRVHSIVIKFAGNNDLPDAKSIEFFQPEEETEEDE